MIQFFVVRNFFASVGSRPSGWSKTKRISPLFALRMIAVWSISFGGARLKRMQFFLSRFILFASMMPSVSLSSARLIETTSLFERTNSSIFFFAPRFSISPFFFLEK